MPAYYSPHMQNAERISQMFSQHAQRAAHGYRAVQAQPNWVTRIALLTFVIVIGVPIAILVLFALFAAVAVFFVLALFATLVAKVRGSFPGDDGRSNVRVIQRRE